MLKKLPKVYNPEDIEEKLYGDWLERNYFHAEVQRGREKFSMVIPPPNVTGILHIGHALNNTLQDIIVRLRRMEGYVTTWIPGTDHAGIATQNVVERQLEEEGLSLEEVGREEFERRVWEWKEKYGARIINQLKRLGTSCDWQRERFTMDEGCSRAVKREFVTLYNEGLIYRGKYIINWCPRCHTALSDIEVEHVEKEGKFYYIRYPLSDGSGHVTVATTRPETMLGDTGVAVNPTDKRYNSLIGETVILPLLDREIPIIADKYVDTEFGTGALKVTPAHDPNDFEIGKKHGLDTVNIFTKKAKINKNGGPYEGLTREEARKKVVSDLKQKGLLEKVETLKHSIGRCYRCDNIIEPYLSTQWFVKMKPLAEPAIKVVKEGKINFYPERFKKIYFHWLENIRDWCISRQLWWGHRIPVYYCEDCGEIIASEEEVTECPQCKSSNIRQDEDVLDTWFSSALWPFSTFGWPDQTEDLDYFYPTDLLVTAHDIIFFWVARMIMMGLKLTGDIPFKDVYIHTLVRDEDGQKMSKSRGNVIDPIEIIEEYGTDALRFTLAHLAAPGQNIYLSEEKIEGSRNFANKIWNASRFILMNIEDSMNGDLRGHEEKFGLAEKWILSRLSKTVEETYRYLTKYDFAAASGTIYNFFWDEFCDVYVELSKIAFYSENRNKDTVGNVLVYVLKKSLKLLHPIMPFITEHIYRKLPGSGKESLVVSSYPKKLPYNDEISEKKVSKILDVVKAIRSLKANISLTNLTGFDVYIKSGKFADVIKENKDYINELSGSKRVHAAEDISKPDGALTAVFAGGEAYIPLDKDVDIDKLTSRIKKRIADLESDLNRASGKLKNRDFLNNAPPEIVEKVRTKKIALEDKYHRLERLLSEIRG